MTNTPWILLDLKTTGFVPNLFVIELAAQRMSGWQSNGERFRILVNQNQEIAPEVSRLRGYTRESIERDGESPLEVYRAFADYAGKLPLVSFNLEYHLNEVLQPEWKRLQVSAIGSQGFCALRLTQRLLDPVPAGNCQLETLRQYYQLPKRDANSALREVQIVADLFAKVLRPIAEERGLKAWASLSAYASEEWYPSRITFGKHKGRLVREARKDAELRRWLDWLAKSTNPRSASMGRWYLRQLETDLHPEADNALLLAPEINRVGASENHRQAAVGFQSLVLFVNPELAQLRQLVASARARLAELETDYTKEKSRVDAMQAALFRPLRGHYEERDRVRLLVEYRRKYLDAHLRGSDEDAQHAEEHYAGAKAQADRDYEETAAAVEKRKELTTEEEAELSQLWKTLVKLYHPDRFAHEPDKLETYHKLTSAINRAKDEGDIQTLREIAQDPNAFILRQGWKRLDFNDEVEVRDLRRLYETLELEIIAVLESLNQLRESPDYELCRICDQRPDMLQELVTERKNLLEKETTQLQTEASRLAEEINELCGKSSNRTF